MDSSFCYTEHRGDKYKFFENIDEYLHYYKFCYNNNDECNQYKSICGSVGSLLEEKKYELINICARLHYLINKLFNSTQSQDEETHLVYLNFWLNHELHTIDDNICPDNFCQLMRERNVENSTLMKLKSRSYYINKKEVKNINSLYYLYYNYNEIKKALVNPDSSQELVKKYIKYCVEKYEGLKAKCSAENVDLCKALTMFENKYENDDIIKAKIPDWSIDRLPSLHDVEDKKTPDTANSDNETSMSSRESISTENIGQPSGIVILSEDPVELSSGSLMTNTIDQEKDLENLKSDETLQEMKREIVNTEGALDNDTQKIVGPVIGTLGLTSIFFTFYKFTSFGTRWLRGRKSRNTMSYDLNEYRNNFLNNSEYDPILPNNLSYNIVYNTS
ncbi:PIR protein [Plasmodium vivax]|uniref:VIR protein n=1 Tax=Plasmodium vivax TaxID=5855 RepID=A0A565A403_PLAVI|nr:PIR protein [Plasmodium vivax]